MKKQLKQTRLRRKRWKRGSKAKKKIGEREEDIGTKKKKKNKNEGKRKSDITRMKKQLKQTRLRDKDRKEK